MAVIIPIETKYNPRGVKTAIRDLDDFRQAVDKAGGGFSGLAKVSGEYMKSVGRSMTNTGKDLTVGVTLPLVGIGVAAIASQAKFETSMKSLQVNAGASAKQMQSLSDLALQMGADTVFSAGEAADAMLELSKGGLAVADIQAGALKTTMNLAATEGMDLSRAAEIVTQAMNQFGLSAKESARISGVLAAGAVASTAGVEDLAGGLKYVGTTANNFGIDIEDTVTSLAALNNAGIDATTAGTSLNRFFLGLAGTTKKGAATMKDYNLQFFDAQGRLKPLTEIIGELDKELGGLSDKKRTKVLKDIFGVEGMRAANVLMREGVKGFEELGVAVGKQGVDQELAAARMSGTAGALEQLKGSLETAAIAIGQVLAPMIQKVAKFLQGLVDRFQALDPQTQQFAVILGIVAAAIGPVLMGLGLMVTALGTVVAALGAISAPVLAVVAGIALVVAAVVLLWNRSEAFRDGVISVWNALKQAIASAVNLVKEKLEENADKLQKLREVFGKVWEFVQQYVFPIIAKLVGTYFKTLITILGTVIGGIIEFIGVLVDIGSALFKAGQEVGKFAQAVGERIGEVIRFFRDLPGNIKTAIGNAGTMLLETGRNIVTGLKNGLINAGSAFIGWVTGWIKSILPDPIERFLGISSPSKLFAKIGLNTVDGLVEGLELGKDKAAQKAVDVIQTAYGKVKEKIEDARSFGQGIADSLFDDLDISKAVSDAEETGISIVDALNNQASKSREFAGKMQQLLDAGLNSTTWQAIWNLSASQGTKVADYYLQGNTAELVGRTNEVVNSARSIADAVGTNAALKFKGAGISNAINMLEGLIEELMPQGKKRKQLMGVMDDLADALKRTVRVDVASNAASFSGGGGGGGGGGGAAPASSGGAPTAAPPAFNQNVAAAVQSSFSAKTLAQASVLNTGGNTSSFTKADWAELARLEAANNAAARALGGPVYAGKQYLVGENGPELLTMGGRSGMITSNRNLGGVTVEAGAVQVVVNGGDPAQVQAAVNRAFDDLVRELRAS